jgi:signal transduction histidine kinase
MNSGPRRPPGRLALLVTAITVLPLGLFVWLGWKILQQDRAMELQRRGERLQLAAERVAGTVDRALAASEARLAAGATEWGDGAVAVTFYPDRVLASPPGRVAYLPAVPAIREVPSAVFREAELLEFERRDRGGAIARYRALAASSDSAVRGGALLRLARNLGRSNRSTDALDAYADLDGVDDIGEAGVPLSLIAAWARCTLLEAGRSPELRRESAALLSDLRSGRWPLTEAVYAIYAGDAARWSSADASASASEIFAAALSLLWNQREAQSVSDPYRPGRQIVLKGGVPLTVLWQQSGGVPRVLIASMAFANREWFASADALAGQQQVSLEIVDDGQSSGRPTSLGEGMRVAANTFVIDAARSGLPWSLRFQPAVTATNDGFLARERLLIAGFGLLVVFSAAASWAILRAVSREMAVARLQSDFVAAVSHEFRTPLTALRQFTEMLQRSSPMTEERRRLCYDAQARATERLSKLVESMLDFGGMEAGAKTYNRDPIDAGTLIEQVVARFHDAPQASGRQLVLAGSDPMPLLADAEALELAVWNLLDNAAKYSPPGSEVRIELSTSDGRARIAVRDQGLGISPAEQTRLFRKFERGERARRLGIKGTGIGLAMVDHIVRAHGGRVEVQSAVGTGSTFTILLPLRG